VFFEALIWLVLTGLLVGAMARLALPGKDPLTIGHTILIGLAGAAVSLVLQVIFGPTIWSASSGHVKERTSAAVSSGRLTGPSATSTVRASGNSSPNRRASAPSNSGSGPP